MPIDKTIFGLPFQSNDALHPSREELMAFLESRKKEGRRELHGDDLAPYRELLKSFHAFERNHRRYTAHQDFRGALFYGVLGHSHFVRLALQSAVEQYKYHVHALRALDFNKPAAFIKSAEEEMSSLNITRQDDAIKLARLKGMVNERKKMLKIFRRRWAALTEELTHIALYVRDNLLKIEELCKASIGVLADPQLVQKKEKKLIEEIKSHFKEHLKDRLRQGPVTRQYLEAVKHDVDVLSKEISSLFREETYALTRLYEAIQGHAVKIARAIDMLMPEIESTGGRKFEDDRDLFTRVEQVLVSLLSECHFELKAVEARTETAHVDILFEKRTEMLDLLLELLLDERRSWNDRRSDKDRRLFSNQNYDGHERRNGKSRRSGRKRRKPVNLSLQAIT